MLPFVRLGPHERGEELSPSRRIAILASAALATMLLASCSLMKAEDLSSQVIEQPKADFGPARPAKPPVAASSATAADKPRVFPGTGNFLNTKPPAPQPPSGPDEASLNFEGLDVREAAKVILGDYLRESYTVHPGVTGTVTFRTIKPVPRSALLPILEMLLRQNNAAAVREDGIFKIVPISSVRGSVSPQLGGTNLPLPQGFSVIVVPLKFVGAKEMAKILEPFSAENTVRFDDVRNLVIMAGNQRELRHLLDTIELFDVDWLAGFSIGIFPIRSSDVKALVADLDKVFGATATGPLAGLVRVVPIERLNSLLIVTTQPRYLESAKSWVERLDQLGGTSTGSRLFVYQVRNGKAESLANLISELFTKRSTTSVSLPQLAPGTRAAQIGTAVAGMAAGTAVQAGQQPAQSQPTAANFAIPGAITNVQSDVRVIADKDNNALLILATPNDFEIIESALNKLDVIQKQVLVEVTVCEITLDDTLKYGIDWYINGGDRVGPNSSGTAGSLNLGGLPPTPAGIVPAFTGLQLINRLGGDVRVVLNALGTDGKLAVLATPQLWCWTTRRRRSRSATRSRFRRSSRPCPGQLSESSTASSTSRRGSCCR